ncbi:hypothetical protein [Paenibacillus sedimenti]|uniref:DUF4386 family protein n=1 Tax=Paenibacillus sedimenti TaxID=2770274 RepID=A0A926QLS8_9BACL|nr:hypothetical protein [Paenibacillus sedimenti]MBD0383143.1 hypothetical protein [Paenibacillus sedimenti]
MITVPQSFLRFSGWMLLLAGVIIGIVQAVHLEDIPAGMEEMSYFVDVAVWTHIALYIGITMLLMGLAGLYLRQAHALKWWGWISYGFIFFAYMVDLTHAAIQIFDYPVLFADIQTEEQLKAASDAVLKVQMSDGPGSMLMAVAYPMLLLGALLMSISMLRAKLLTKWPAIMNLVFLFFMFLPYGPVTKYLFALSFLVYSWYGAILAFEKRTQPQIPAVTHGAPIV